LLIADVALPVPLARAYSYEVPPSLAGVLVPGDRVVCPFAGRRLSGVVLAVREAEPDVASGGQLKSIAARLHGDSLPADLLTFVREVSSYYLAPIGEAAKLALPPVDRATAKETDELSLFTTNRGVSSRTTLWVRPSATTTASEGSADAPPAPALRGQAGPLLNYLRGVGEAHLPHLTATWKNARSVVARLEAQGLVTTERRETVVAAFSDEVPRDLAPVLTEPQVAAGRAIEEALAAGTPQTFLLHGVTGSGKTEVYLHAIAAAKAQGRGSIVLVPEIALTPQLVGRFRARFGDDVAVMHSALSPKERLVMWRRLHSGAVDTAIGARSVLFAPVGKLGLIVVDEEHDSSFKQEEGVRYHARDMAILRAHRAGGVVILGSATPSLESERLVTLDRARKLALPERARAQELPRVELIDLRRTPPGPSGDKRLSLPLHRALQATLDAGGQAILFLNRRGFAPSVRCEACGEVAACPSCSVALTFHKPGTLRCHYCDRIEPFVQECPKCKAPARTLEGLGTEKLEETVATSFPGARVARMDRDVASGKKVGALLDRMRAREIDVLVGTQMVTKGHDLPHVTLVGVINADAALSLPDFRAAERAFQLLVQVAGRAGRGDMKGRVLIQTYDPEHPAVAFAAKHDVAGFLAREMLDRRELMYPPFTRLALARVDAVDENEAREAAQHLAAVAREAAASDASGGALDVLGPAPAPIARVRNRFRYRVMIRSADRQLLRRVLLAIERARRELPRTVRGALDVDPVALL
jgi:primosomal protein N' (replication factor Y)